MGAKSWTSGTKGSSYAGSSGTFIVLGVAQLLFVLLEVVVESFAVSRPAFGASDGVELQPDVFYSDLLQSGGCDPDDLCVSVSGLGSEELDAQLVEFPESSCLGLLIPEAGEDVICADGKGACQNAVLYEGADDARGSFRTQGDGSSALVLHRVHLLADDVGGVTDSALEQLGVLKGGSPRLLIAEALAHAAQNALHILPSGDVGRQNVCGPARGSDLICHE